MVGWSRPPSSKSNPVKHIILLIKRASPLFRLATEYTAAHIAARLLAAISGIMLVRLLPVSEYGFYSLVLAAFSFICTFSDLGATETLSFFRWRAGKKNKPWIPYFHTVLRFRRTVFAFSFVASAAYIIYTGQHIGEDMQTIFAGIVLMGLAAWFAIHSGIISYVLKLEQYFRQAYAVELSNEATKLLAVGLIWAFRLATAIAGMVSITVGAILAAILATRLLGQRFAKIGKPKQRQIYQSRRLLLGQIMPILPGTMHFALQGLLITWLAAYYGSVVNVAEVGALGRIGVLIGVISGFTGTVFIPRLIAISDDALFIKRYLQWWVVMLVIGGIMMMFVWVYPEALLFLLGNSYSGLHMELIVVAATAVVWTWNGYVYGVNRARGWVKRQEYILFVLIAGQIGMFTYLEFSSTLDVLFFGMGTSLIWVTYQLGLNIAGFIRVEKYGKHN
jgi:O-antigen/teichoic acid export membrane protein